MQDFFFASIAFLAGFLPMLPPPFVSESDVNIAVAGSIKLAYLKFIVAIGIYRDVRGRDRSPLAV